MNGSHIWKTPSLAAMGLGALMFLPIHTIAAILRKGSRRRLVDSYEAMWGIEVPDLEPGQLTTKRLFDRAVDRFGLGRRGEAPEEETVRHGTTISDQQVNTMLRMFELLDRGGDASTIAKAEPIRRFRETLIRMRDKSETGKPRNGAARGLWNVPEKYLEKLP